MDALIDESLEQLFGLPVPQSVKDTLRPILLSNLPDASYWTFGWNAWVANPMDQAIAGALTVRLQAYLYRVLQMEEFQLC